jgi:hypothetical protein
MTVDEPPTFLPLSFSNKPAKEGIKVQQLDKIAGQKAESLPYHTARDYAEAYHSKKNDPCGSGAEYNGCYQEKR